MVDFHRWQRYRVAHHRRTSRCGIFFYPSSPPSLGSLSDLPGRCPGTAHHQRPDNAPMARVIRGDGERAETKPQPPEGRYIPLTRRGVASDGGLQAAIIEGTPEGQSAPPGGEGATGPSNPFEKEPCPAWGRTPEIEAKGLFSQKSVIHLVRAPVPEAVPTRRRLRRFYLASVTPI